MADEKMCVDAEEVARDWGVSKSQAYKIIQKLNDHRQWEGKPELL